MGHWGLLMGTPPVLGGKGCTERSTWAVMHYNKGLTALQGARELGWLLSMILNQHKGAGPFATHGAQPWGRGSHGQRASSSLQPQAGPAEGLRWEPETWTVSGARARSPWVLKGWPWMARGTPNGIYALNKHFRCTYCVPERGRLPLTCPAPPAPATVPPVASLPISFSDPHSLPGARAEKTGRSLIASLSSVTWIGGDISRARSCIPVAAYSPCHRRSSKLSPAES